MGGSISRHDVQDIPAIVEFHAKLAGSRSPEATVSRKELRRHLEDMGFDSDDAADAVAEFPSRMTIEHTGSFLLSPLNSAEDILRKEEVSFDLPLHDYFINSSHNTYLTGDQLQSSSKASMYRDVLLSGCRCVELDCWDGPGGQPVIFHGHTLTSKITFRDACKSIASAAFGTSPLPVILSLEVHTSQPQQRRMAEIMKDVFGDSLLVPRREGGDDALGSPARLRGKILVKGNVRAQAKRGAGQRSSAYDYDDDDESEEDDDDSASVSSLEASGAYDSASSSASSSSAFSSSASSSSSSSSALSVEKRASRGWRLPVPSMGRKSRGAGGGPGGPQKNKGAAHAHHGVDAELSRLITVPSHKFKDMASQLQAARPCLVTSFAEGKINGIAASSSSASSMREVNDAMLSRVYPAGARVDSSNYDPSVAWGLGCQLVALNFQHHLRSPGRASTPMVKNDALFRNCGNLGYVPKSTIIKGADRVRGKRLRVEIICGSDMGVSGAVFLRVGVGARTVSTGAADLHARTAFVKFGHAAHTFEVAGATATAIPFLTVECFRTRFDFVPGSAVAGTRRDSRAASLHSRRTGAYAAPVSQLREGLRSISITDPKHDKAKLLVNLTFE